MKGLYKKVLIMSILVLILTVPYGHKPGQTGILELSYTTKSLSSQKPYRVKMGIFSLLLEKAIAYQQAYVTNRLSESLFPY